ncbi:MAG: zinc-dependent peptidase, partial [Candidatus Wenzhouxiangella sp. M2_3B_020]
IRLFLHDKRFHGFQGLRIDDEIRVTIAANACILLLNRSGDEYRGFTSIYVYPSTFVVEHETRDGPVRRVGRQARLGESWHRGPLVLAWDAALHGTRDMRDGHNVILHEFAHKLDGADGAVDGAPPLSGRSQYASWARVMTREYRQLRRMADRRARTVMDHYGASEPQEFFAVLVETFYEKPRQLRRRHPELYAAMVRCFDVDPAEWRAQAGNA